MLLPNRIVFPLYGVGLIFVLGRLLQSENTSRSLVEILSATFIGGGIFWLLFQFSKGKWIGGGDVKIGFLIGMLSGTPVNAILLLFFASLLGTLYSAPLLMKDKKSKSSLKIPFGPFLLIGCYVAVVFGQMIIDWYLGLTFTID